MVKPVTIANTFATQVGNVPASELDANYSVLSNAINDLGTYANYGTDTGAANAYILGYPSGITITLADGIPASFIPLNNNTGASTINVGGSGSLPLVRPDGSALLLGDLNTGNIYPIIYNATSGSWQLTALTQSFTGTIANPGFEVSPTGLITQFGSSVVTTNGGGDFTVAFAERFPNNVFTVVACIGDTNSLSLTMQIIQSSVTKTSFGGLIEQSFSNYGNASARINWNAFGN